MQPMRPSGYCQTSLICAAVTTRHASPSPCVRSAPTGKSLLHFWLRRVSHLSSLISSRCAALTQLTRPGVGVQRPPMDPGSRNSPQRIHPT
eukprot:6184194-Pleurochrysis_carterae.AAC.1